MAACCPTGVTTQDPLRARALVPADKAERVRNFHHSTLHALQELVQAAGLNHPGQISAEHIMRRISDTEVRPLSQLIAHLEPGALLGSKLTGVWREHWDRSSAAGFALLPATEGKPRAEGRRKAVVADEVQAPLLLRREALFLRHKPDLQLTADGLGVSLQGGQKGRVLSWALQHRNGALGRPHPLSNGILSQTSLGPHPISSSTQCA
jgi:hypothetical protein